MSNKAFDHIKIFTANYFQKILNMACFFYNFNKTKDVPEKRPAYVFCIEASSQCLSLGIFSKVLDNISTFLENDIDEEIPFMICTYSDRVIFKVL